MAVSKHLHGEGLTIGFICIDDHYDHNHHTKDIISEQGFEIHAFCEGILELLTTKALYVMNDWGGVVHDLVLDANQRGLITFGAVEGVNDFDDRGYKIDGQGRMRNPYNTVNHVFLTSRHDLRYFPKKECYIVGIPRVDSLVSEAPTFPDKDEVLINSNFTYGIYSDRRDQWIEDVVDVVTSLGLSYKISVHPSDDGDLRKYVVSENKFLDDLRSTTLLVSRFSGCMLECLALGKPCVYYDSFNEAVSKFKHPLGAFSIAKNKSDLKDAIKKETSQKTQVECRAKQFLDLHLSVDDRESSSLRIAKQIADIVQNV